MADRPIIFSAPMIRALLAGRKTQTRRIIKPQPRKPAFCDGYWYDAGEIGRDGAGERAIVHFDVGDSLWVREAHAGGTLGVADVVYRAEHQEAKFSGPRVDIRWRPSIHMHRAASRLTLDVTDVRVQRLRDISEEDAVAEGALRMDHDEDFKFYEEDRFGTHYCGFVGLWSHINGLKSWDANPWVAAITFDVRHGNIDALTAHASPPPTEAAHAAA